MSAKRNSVLNYYKTNMFNTLKISDLMDFEEVREKENGNEGSGPEGDKGTGEEDTSKDEVEKLANKIESCARVFFPLSYGSFLLLYFIFYLNRQTDLKQEWSTLWLFVLNHF